MHDLVEYIRAVRNACKGKGGAGKEGGGYDFVLLGVVESFV